MTGSGVATRLTGTTARQLDACIASGGVAVFPSDTVYGLAADPESEPGVRRLYELKRRPAGMPSAVMFFAAKAALAALPELGPRTRTAFERLLPGPVTLLVPSPADRYPLARGSITDLIGIRVPALTGPLVPLAGLDCAVLQSSANLHGGPDPRRLADVPAEIRAAADLVLDGGDLPGTASTVVDLGDYETDGRYRVLREGAMSPAELRKLL